MKISLFHRRSEGETCRQGLNWTWDSSSKPLTVFKLWRLYIYFRRRTDYIMSAGAKRRYIFGFDWHNFWTIGSIRPDFERRGIIVGDVPVSLEFIEDVIVPLHKRWKEGEDAVRIVL